MATEKKKSKAKIIVLAVILLSAALVGGYFYLNKDDSTGSVYVMPVSSVASSDAGSVNRFSGIVEAHQTVEYQLDTNKVLKETFVEVGDEVSVGDVLFSYDTNSIKLEIEQINIDIQRLNGEITSNKELIEELKKQQASAGEDEQLDYSLHIQELQNDNQSKSYTIKTKKNELAVKKESLNNTEVVSEVNGIVKSVGTTNNGYNDNNNAYITIMESGEYVVKGTINEMNIYQLPEGTPVIIYSRIDDSSWTGYVNSIDTSSEVNENNNFYVDAGGQSATKYYFYVSLDSNENMFLGQHVIIKPGEENVREGLWLSEFYICDIDSNPYVYMDNNGKIKKQSLTLGEYDDVTFEYQIVSGLTLDDYIAYPEEGIVEGSKTTTEYTDVDTMVEAY